MAGKGGKVTSGIDTRDASQILADQRKKFRTTVTPTAYMDPYIDALDDLYCNLNSDIRRMKAHNPVPQEVLAEAEEELTRLKKTMMEAGFEFCS